MYTKVNTYFIFNTPREDTPLNPLPNKRKRRNKPLIFPSPNTLNATQGTNKNGREKSETLQRR